MILINGNWERVDTYDDCMRIIRDTIGEEFEARLKKIMKPPEDTKKRLNKIIGDINDAMGDLDVAKDELADFSDLI